MPTTNLMISILAEKCRNLTDLNLSCVTEFNDTSLNAIALNLKQLHSLDISWNEGEIVLSTALLVRIFVLLLEILS